MRKLFEGVLEFQRDEFEKKKELFYDLRKQQAPHTLFITCSDSRVNPNLITQTEPGEMFIVRNIANLVPPYRASGGYGATTSAIEYAVQMLEVQSIVVCGHSNCGGCQALYAPPEKMEKIPHVRKWLELAAPVKEEAKKLVPDHDEKAREWVTEHLNVVQQLEHLMTYPFVRERVEAGTLKLYGWYYIIKNGEVHNFDPEIGKFVPVTECRL